MNLLIHGGTVVTSRWRKDVNILVRNGVIEAVGGDMDQRTDQTVNATGLEIFPGGIDVHTHLDLDTGVARASDDWYTGTVAAACGGTTTVVDHPAFGPSGCSLMHQIEKYHGLAGGAAVIDYSFHGVIQHVTPRVLADIPELIRRGISTAKIYMTYSFRLSDGDILKALSRMGELGALTAAHCENHAIIEHLRETYVSQSKTEPRYHALSRPAASEAEAVARLSYLSRVAGNAPIYIVHLSSKAGLEEVRRASDCGARIYAETCPQYLLLSEDRYDEPEFGGLKYIMSPPLRSAGDQEALWEGLADGTIQTVGTDHCPFYFDEKKRISGGDFSMCPGGAPAIELRMALLYSEGVSKGRIKPERFAECTATMPAKLMGLYPKKGEIAPGSDADFVFFDPKKSVTVELQNLHERVDYTPYAGMELRGAPVVTMLRGNIIAEMGKFTGPKGLGEFLPRETLL